MGLSLVLRRSRKLPAKMATMTQLVPDSMTLRPPQKAFIKMVMPAEAIMATTAGRREPRTLCSTLRFRYLRYSLAINVTRMQAGRIHPAVATRAPTTPPILVPTKVAALTAMGPGVISAMVTRLANSVMDSQLWVVTIWASIRGMAA